MCAELQLCRTMIGAEAGKKSSIPATKLSKVCDEAPITIMHEEEHPVPWPLALDL